MHKKLESELMSIAHSILQMKNKNDVVALKEKAQELYERLSVLAFVDEYIESTPDTEETNKTLVSKIELAVKGVFTDKEQVVEKEKVEVTESVLEESAEGIDSDIESNEESEMLVDKLELAMKGVFTDPNTTEEVVVEAIIEEPIKEPVETPKKQLSLEEEFKDAVSVDITQDLFQKVDDTGTSSKTTLNDTLMQKNIQVGLNDRIAFVKHLFNHSQADFNRVLSQLNSIDTEKEAINFINKMVKPDYDWSGKEEYEERLIALIERKF
ncbi:MAG: hypothetical protein PSN34_08355 [Urechidicola sp.]|nr:hypothetical protein [Urechidicola sp.]